jgi:hypothetical protein
MDKWMILLAPGGVGNQIFSLAAALRMNQNRQQRVIVLSNNKELVSKFKETKRYFEKKIKVHFIYSQRVNLFLNKLSSRAQLIGLKFPKVENYLAQKFRTVLSPWEFPNELVDEESGGIWVLRGFFQDKKLIEELSQYSKQFLGLMLNVNLEDNKATLEKNSIGVHIRRGDYRLIPSYGLLSLSYFKKLIAKLGNENTKILIASDEIEVSNRLEVEGEKWILDPDSCSPLETISALARVNTFLMSNSTFSFWAAWAVHSRGGAVYMPEPWFKEGKVPADFLYLDKFIKSTAEFED